jgi:hypothetical protein
MIAAATMAGATAIAVGAAIGVGAATAGGGAAVMAMDMATAIAAEVITVRAMPMADPIVGAGRVSHAAPRGAGADRTACASVAGKPSTIRLADPR